MTKKKTLRVENTKQLLKMFPEFKQRQHPNTLIVSGDEILVHSFKSVRNRSTDDVLKTFHDMALIHIR